MDTNTTNTGVNTPYVKKNANDELVESYFSIAPNRRARRQKIQRFQNNRAGYSNVVRTPMGAYKKVVQWEIDKEGDYKKIEHYILIDKSKGKRYEN